MKKYYNTLDKKKKDEIKKEYQKTYQKTDLNTRLTRLLVYSIIGYITGIAMILEVILTDAEKTGNIIIAITLFIAATVFLVGRIKIKNDVLNKLALKKK